MLYMFLAAALGITQDVCNKTYAASAAVLLGLCS